MNPHINIFVGENDSGKTTLLEAISIVLSGKLNGLSINNKMSLDWFNDATRKAYQKAVSDGQTPELPSIVIEAFLVDEQSLPAEIKGYRGSNNSLLEDAIGIKVIIGFNSQYASTYTQLLAAKKITDIPIELYKVEYRSFANPEYYLNTTGKQVASIDTTRKDYGSVLSRFVSSSLNSYLTEEQMTNLRLAYRSNRNSFIQDSAVTELNTKLQEDYKYRNRTVTINLRDGDVDGWKSEMEVSLDGIPLENMGFGTQNMFKAEMLVQQNSDIEILIIEESENNLSYTNMSLLISRLAQDTNRQLFVSTHSSFVANKLGLNSIQLIRSGNVTSFAALDKDTYDYFVKLPGYNTLRAVLANGVILVEGPADELIIQRAYLDNYGNLPIEDGIDVIAVSGVGFQRYCKLAQLINKHIIVVTDNDRNRQAVIDRYEEYGDIVTLCVEECNDLHTLEPSILHANKDSFDEFRSIVYRGHDIDSKTYDELEQFMKTDRNKTTWSFRVFESEKKIKYPKYILKAIGQSDE